MSAEHRAETFLNLKTMLEVGCTGLERMGRKSNSDELICQTSQLNKWRRMIQVTSFCRIINKYVLKYT
jgi:hypothetical protein